MGIEFWKWFIPETKDFAGKDSAIFILSLKLSNEVESGSDRANSESNFWKKMLFHTLECISMLQHLMQN